MLSDEWDPCAAEVQLHALQLAHSANKGRLSAFSSGARVGDALVWIREVGAWLGFCYHVISRGVANFSPAIHNRDDQHVSPSVQHKDAHECPHGLRIADVEVGDHVDFGAGTAGACLCRTPRS